jgi:hypothetical protein
MAMDVRIGTIETEIVVTEAVGPLQPAEVQRLVALVLAEVRRELGEQADRARDTGIRNRVFDVPI